MIRRRLRGLAALGFAALAGCAAPPPGPGAGLEPGAFVGFAEDPLRPASLAYRPVELEIPECGYAIGAPAEWTVTRERRTREDGRRSLTVTIKTPDVGTEARRRFFDHALDPATVDPTARIVVDCFENRTRWSPERFAARYAESSDTVRLLETTVAPGGAEGGLALTSDADAAGPTIRSKPFLVWKVGDNLWTVVRPMLIERNPRRRYVETYPCGPLVDHRTTPAGRWVAANPDVEGPELNRRAAEALTQAEIAEYVAAVAAYRDCLEAVRAANGLEEGASLRFARSADLNDAWFRDLIATIRPLPGGPTGFGGGA